MVTKIFKNQRQWVANKAWRNLKSCHTFITMSFKGNGLCNETGITVKSNGKLKKLEKSLYDDGLVNQDESMTGLYQYEGCHNRKAYYRHDDIFLHWSIHHFWSVSSTQLQEAFASI